MEERGGQWEAADDNDFWGRATVAQRLAATRKAEQETFSLAWSRIFYASAAAVALSAWLLLTLR